MLEITDAAGKRMSAALAEASAGDDECFRIVVTEDGAQLVRDERKPDDVALQHEDKVVLVMDGDTAEFLKEEKIDYDEAKSALVFA